METGDKSATTCVIVCSLFVNNIIYRMLCLVKTTSQRFLSYTLISHINAHAVRGRPTLDDVESFRNGPVHELYSLKANQMCEVHTSSHDITEPNVSSNYENTSKPVTADLTTNYDAETNTSLAVKIKNVREHNFEGGSNNSELDKDTDRSNLNSKVKYLSLALPLNILVSVISFTGFNTCKVRFGISYTISIIIVQAIVNVGLLYVWSCMYLVEDMNTLDDCDLLEKVVNMTNVHEHNSVAVSIKVQQFRSRSAKYVYYNCTRVLCECHGYKRDREPTKKKSSSEDVKTSLSKK